jgi:hypothetical protein
VDDGRGRCHEDPPHVARGRGLHQHCHSVRHGRGLLLRQIQQVKPPRAYTVWMAWLHIEVEFREPMWITMSLEKAGWRRDTGPAMFEAEAAGLNAMHATGTIRVPKPLKVSMPSLLGSVQ